MLSVRYKLNLRVKYRMTIVETLRIILNYAKGKGHPATGRGGTRGSGEVKAPYFLDVLHYEGGRSSAICTDRLYPRRDSWYSFSGTVSTPGRGEPRKKSSVTPPGMDPGTSRLVAQCLNHYAISGYIKVCYSEIIYCYHPKWIYNVG